MAIGVMLRLVCGRFAAVETWYSRDAGSVADGVAAGMQLAKIRAKPLANNAYVEGYRVFDSEVKYSVKNVTLTGTANGEVEMTITGGQPSTTSNRADVQTTSLLCKATGIAGGRQRTGNRELFGVPDVCMATTADGMRVFTPTTTFATALNQYTAELIAHWDFRVLTISPRHAITSLVVDSAPPNHLGLVVNLAGDPLIVPGARVRIRGSRKLDTTKSLNGVWTVARIDPPVAPSANSTVYLLASNQIDSEEYDPLGTVEGIGYTFCHVSDYTVQRPMGRRRGGSCGLPHGRSRIRAR